MTARQRAQLEDVHWWYRGRRRILRAAIGEHGLGAGSRVLDAGCGSGALLADLAATGAAVSGIEPDTGACARAQARRVGEVRAAALASLPFEDGAFDLITCLDVLEHVDDDLAALRELRRVTARDGRLLVTVPNHPWLWSGHDVAAGHVRRYNLRRLQRAARDTGWVIATHTTFNVFLLPAIIVTRVTQRLLGTPPRSSLLTTPRGLDAVLELPLRAEAALLARGWRLAAGLSILLVLEPRG